MAAIGNNTKYDMTYMYVNNTVFTIYLFNATIAAIAGVTPQDALTGSAFSPYLIGTSNFLANNWTCPMYVGSPVANSVSVTNGQVFMTAKSSPPGAVITSYGVFVGTSLASAKMVTCGDFTAPQTIPAGAPGSGTIWTVPAGSIQWTIS